MKNSRISAKATRRLHEQVRSYPRYLSHRVLSWRNEASLMAHVEVKFGHGVYYEVWQFLGGRSYEWELLSGDVEEDIDLADYDPYNSNEE